MLRVAKSFLKKILKVRLYEKNWCFSLIFTLQVLFYYHLIEKKNLIRLSFILRLWQYKNNLYTFSKTKNNLYINFYNLVLIFYLAICKAQLLSF